MKIRLNKAAFKRFWNYGRIVYNSRLKESTASQRHIFEKQIKSNHIYQFTKLVLFI